jgi:histidinol-phosphate aminotransferase
MDAVKKLVRRPLALIPAYHLPLSLGARVKLDANESPFPLPEPLMAELGVILARVPLHRYPDKQASALRGLLSGELGCRPSQLAFGNGSDELIALLNTAFSEPRVQATRGRLLSPSPTFVLYQSAAVAAGLEPFAVPLRDDFTLDQRAWMQALAEVEPNLVFLARPNNPTGTLWPREIVVRTLLHRPHCLVVVDEAYVDYCGESVLDLLSEHPNLVVLRTLSKVGLAGLRVGYAVAAEEVIEEIERVRMPYNVSALAQAAAVWLLSSHRGLLDDWAREVVRERTRLSEALVRLEGLTVFPSKANMLLFRIGVEGDGRAARLFRGLVSRGVYIRNLDRPGALAGCLRVTVGTPVENDAFVASLLEVLEESRTELEPAAERAGALA